MERTAYFGTRSVLKPCMLFHNTYFLITDWRPFVSSAMYHGSGIYGVLAMDAALVFLDGAPVFPLLWALLADGSQLPPFSIAFPSARWCFAPSHLGSLRSTMHGNRAMRTSTLLPSCYQAWLSWWGSFILQRSPWSQGEAHHNLRPNPCFTFSLACIFFFLHSWSLESTSSGKNIGGAWCWLLTPAACSCISLEMVVMNPGTGFLPIEVGNLDWLAFFLPLKKITKEILVWRGDSSTSSVSRKIP